MMNDILREALGWNGELECVLEKPADVTKGKEQLKEELAVPSQEQKCEESDALEVEAAKDSGGAVSERTPRSD